MIVVAILGILGAVVFQIYLGYINKARIVSYLYPGLHAIETNITLYYGINGNMPGQVDLPVIMEGADTTHFNVVMENDKLKITIDSPTLLRNLQGYVLYAKPKIGDGTVSSWELSGNLANKLGIVN
jgi:type IV pilus assembly protein PilA